MDLNPKLKRKNGEKALKIKIELKEKHIQAEVLELYDNNSNNDEIKNI